MLGSGGGQLTTKGKIHWRSWSRMCVRKENGELGFCNLHIFNQAMLAKQSWQIIRRPNSLLTQVLRGKYFKTENFLSAGLGHNASYAWRSILWGRSLFEKGYRWRVGNGQFIQVTLGYQERESKSL